MKFLSPGIALAILFAPEAFGQQGKVPQEKEQSASVPRSQADLTDHKPTGTDEVRQDLSPFILLNPGSGLALSPPTLTVQNGAVYLVMLGGRLIAMPGGGASGCFSTDLPRRIERLKTFIQALPSGPKERRFERGERCGAARCPG